jgi:hypothetical protein
MSMACYLINRSPRIALDGRVAKEVWIGNELLWFESIWLSSLCAHT